MQSMDIQQIVKTSPFFRYLAETHYGELAEVGVLKRYKKREHLFYQGQKGAGMYLLVHGNVQLHKNTEDGREVVIRVVRPGDVFAEVVLFERERYPVSGRAVTDVDALFFSRNGIQRLLGHEPFRNNFIAMLMEKQRYLANRIEELTTQDVNQRFFAFLKNQYGVSARIEVPLSKKDVAAAIGTTPESLSRLIQRLQDESVIRWKGKTIDILSAPWDWVE